jgi:DNA-binding transcriptional regulator YdaS (Cro superfamily)
VAEGGAPSSERCSAILRATRGEVAEWLKAAPC